MRMGMRKELLQKRTLALAAVMITAVILIGSNISGLAKDRRQDDGSCKYYSSILIERGDTLWSIASEHMIPEYDRVEEYIEEIRRLNHLTSDGIYAGEYLTIPCCFQSGEK